MPSRYLWSWFALAAVLVLALLWTHRYQYAACDVDGCVVIHRWSGAVEFRATGAAEAAPPGGSVVVRRRGRAPGATRALVGR